VVRGYDELPDGVLIADSRATIAEVNRAACELLGRSEDALVGEAVADALSLMDLEGREWWKYVDPYGGLLSRTRLVESGWYLPDGREVLLTARLIRNRPRGRVTRMVVCLRDAQVRRRTDRMRSDLVATVAHELRSPLTGVKGFTSTLLSKWERFSDQQRRLMLETVDADADRLTRLIAELLDVARIESRRLTLRRQPVDLAAATRSLLATYPLPENRAMWFDADTVPEVWVDPDKFAQVLLNLLDNAVRHGDGLIRIGVSAREQFVDVWVEDEGEGVPPKMRDRVFAKYWRRGERTGTGLGLYIVRGMVTAHGGEVQVEEASIGGARFRVSFPVGAPPGVEG
jgi:PAS domain S-box-containing protein